MPRLAASHPRVPVLMACSLLLVSCATPGGSQPPTGAGASGQRTPSLAFTFTGASPVVTRQSAGLDDLYINPGAVIEGEGQWHMYANVFSHWPGVVRIPHLVSEDGATWRLAEDAPVFSSRDIPFVDNGADVSAGFVTADGTWVLIFETVELSDPWVLGRATAPGPDGPWTIDPEPILTPGPTGAWDAGGLQWPSVVKANDGYLMYFTALDRRGGRGSIGLATSDDGVTWTKHDGPVLQAEADWERGQVDRPRVTVTPRGLAMVYAGGRLTDRGLAWSDDGIAWHRDGSLPVITQDSFPVDGQAWDAALVYRDGRLDYYLEIGAATGTGGTNVYLARAPLD